MNKALIIGGVVFGIFFLILIVAAMIFLGFMLFGKKKKFPFILINVANPSQWKTYEAKPVFDDKSKNNKQFYIKKLDVKLDMKKADFSIDNVGYRLITHNEKNEIVYLDKEMKMDIQDDIKFSLSRQEKELALYHYDTYNKKYEETLDKTKLMNVIALLGFALLLIIGMAVQGFMLVQTGGKLVSFSEEGVKMRDIEAKMSANIKTASENLQLVSQQQSIITAKLESVINELKTDGVQLNITRTLS